MNTSRRSGNPHGISDYRLPFKGNFDLTYRCNNDCRHCWLRLPEEDHARYRELSFEEIRDIIDQSRLLGTRHWSISGGEPMVRPDFPEIFDYMTRKAISYTLNTNGTLITPSIARLLMRKGTKLVALYGATGKTYDHVTRHPGGFEMAMRGFSYLKENGTGFAVQLIPMRDNWHEWEAMKELARSLSPRWRVGAPWLHLSSSRDPMRNAEISRQRLGPSMVVELDRPDVSKSDRFDRACRGTDGDDRLFARCIAGKRGFHIDPFGGMSFCPFIKDPVLRYDLRQGSVREGWEDFIPSLADKVRGGAEYGKRCLSCERRNECRWCPVYGWLEHGRYSAPVEHLCDVAAETRRFTRNWRKNHRRYFRIAGITLRVDSDLPIEDRTFQKKFDPFRAEGPGEDMATIRHSFGLPEHAGRDLGLEVYRKPPWAIYRRNGSYIYLGISPSAGDPGLHRLATFTHDHTRALIYNDREDRWRSGGLHSLTMFPTDQILIARLLADRQGFYLHSAGAILNGAGFLFVGHSEAGKSTTTRLLMEAGAVGKARVEILCDDRNIVRCGADGWRVFGTWSHGDVPVVSAADAPLRAVCFLEKGNENTLKPLTDRAEAVRRLLAFVIRPFVTADWWEKTLDLLHRISRETPCHIMRFDMTGAIVEKLIEESTLRDMLR